jgi:hypothetical protein
MQVYRDFEIKKVGADWEWQHQFFRGHGTSGTATSLASAYGMIEDWYSDWEEDNYYDDSPYADEDDWDHD